MEWTEFIKNTTKTKLFKGTWLERQGESYEYLLSEQELGLRISIHTWLDTNEVEVRLIEGDGRSAYFKRYKAITLLHPTEEQVKTAILEITKQYPTRRN